MAKNRRKPSSAQRDKSNIALAKKLKQSGIISKQAKLHSGAYISKEVLAKVRKYKDAANLNYGTVKVSKKKAEQLKERGYEIVQGNRVIGPKTNTFRARLKSDKITGVKPVKGGYMEEVFMPNTMYEIRSLIDTLKDGIDSLKLPNEHFAFTYHGHESYRTFKDSNEMAEYLMRYQSIDSAFDDPLKALEAFNGLAIFRLHPADTANVIPGATARRKRANMNRSKNRPARQTRPREELSILQQKRLRDREREKAARKRERIRKDPIAYENYKAKERERKKKK